MSFVPARPKAERLTDPRLATEHPVSVIASRNDRWCVYLRIATISESSSLGQA